MTHQPESASSDSQSAPPTPVDWPSALVEHRQWLWTVVLARLGDASAAEEVLQQVALAAAEHAGRIRDPAKLAPWLYRVAVTQSLLHRRQMGRGRKLLNRYQAHQPPTEQDNSQPDPLDWLLAQEQQQLVQQAMGRLAGRDREILLLKYTQDWTYRELAQHLGISEAAIEGRLHRARKRLRNALVARDPTLASTP